MVRQWKETRFTGDEGSGGSSYGEELRRLVFVLWAVFVTLSFLVAIIFCADGMSKEKGVPKERASGADNYGHGSTCGAGCGGGCGG
ncbi:hypothetical protein TanjilG_15837 [Lupinus angustifolius]|uniref:Transmembrane protein n=1 Tax=Lupinus angustifolius TaxID=3871 RepID=A0A1J7IFI2_LUPAN|nr:hypothetical protein TanjilG_15837 [Lupinus angustifolius]